MRHWIITGLLCLIIAVAMGGEVRAQSQPVPPEHYTLDPRGVDLVSGQFVYQTTEVAIGQSDAGGLSYGRLYLSNGGWRNTLLGTLNASGSTYVVSIGSDSEFFTKSGTVFTPQSNNGAKLSQSGSTYTFTTSSGAVATMTPVPGGFYDTPYTVNTALLQTLTTPAGEVTNYNYLDEQYCSEFEPGGACRRFRTGLRLQSITNNRGYMLHLEYAGNTLDPNPDIAAWLQLVSVTGLNLAVDYCYPLDFVCGSLTRTWPSVTYSAPGMVPTSTDQSGRTTTYPSTGGFGVVLPGSSVTDVAVSFASGKVSSLTDASGTWTYAYSTPALNTQQTIMTGPLGQQLTVLADMTTGRATSVAQLIDPTTTPPTTATTAYQYDGQRRLTRITQHEGNRVDYTYDGRGNITQTVMTPKTGSPLSPITTSAAYPAACSNPIICNSPTSTTDANVNTTTYQWDETHGGLLKATSPSPTTGAVQPETRITYASRTAYYKNSAGVIVASASAIALPIATSACATTGATACLGTTDETKTTAVYGAAGVANNLLLTSITSGDGLAAGGLKVTTAMTYDPNGDLQTVDGPLAGTNDTSRFVYDAARERVGTMGPDPDGGGSPLLNRAQRLTYNPRGQVTLIEAGTTTGNGVGDWSSFSPLQRQAVQYDAYGRPVIARQQDAAGTTITLQQVGYDAAGRPKCTTTRMNPTAFGGLPGSTEACAQTMPGAFGPDRIVQTVYDVANRPLSSVSGIGSGATISEAISYTANGQPKTLTDGKGNVSTYVYDGFDRVIRLCYPDSTLPCDAMATDYEAYDYDAASNVVAYRTRGGQTIGASFDHLNRQITLGGSATADRTFSYDNLNRPTVSAFVSGGPFSTNGWDALSRLTSQVQALGTVTYAYDAASRRTSTTWPGSPVFLADYDWNYGDDLTAIRENGATSGPGLLATYGYDDLGRRTTISRSNGAGSAYAYDGLSRLSSLIQNPSGTAQDVTLGFTYNPANQIISRSVSNNAYVYTPTSSVTTYTSNGLNQVTGLSGSGATSIGYDANQNLTTGLGLTYGYDGLSQLTKAGAYELTYDPTGRLYSIGKGATVTRFLYDGQQVIGEYDAGGAMVSRHVPGLGLDDVVTSYTGSGTSNRSWLLSDERQSTIALVDGSGVAGTVNTYDEYGVPGSANAGRFQYTGQMWFSDAGLYHYRARAYAPQLGRFFQTDPIGYGEGANLYAYVGADPINWIDPLGLDRGTPRVCVGPAVGSDDKTGKGNGITTCTDFPSGGGFHFSGGGNAGGSGGLGGGRDFNGPPTTVDDIVVYAADKKPPKGPPSEGHRSGERPSTRNRHEEGDARRQRDRGRERGDDNRRYPRTKPPGFKGPWPPGLFLIPVPSSTYEGIICQFVDLDECRQTET